MTITETTNEIKAFYIEYFQNQFQLRLAQDALQPDFQLEDDYKDAILEDWSWRVTEEQAREHFERTGNILEVCEGRPDPPFVQAHLQVYLRKALDYVNEDDLEDYGVYSPEHEHYAESVFDLAMAWFAWEALQDDEMEE